jgi:hypothetical protein
MRHVIQMLFRYKLPRASLLLLLLLLHPAENILRIDAPAADHSQCCGNWYA